MPVTVAKSAGFCFGVNRAVELVEQAVKEGKQVQTLGPIIHNRHAVKHFENMGVTVADKPEQTKPGSTVVIRSHGVTRGVYEALEHRGVEIIDATCPFVKRIHEIVSKAEQEGRFPMHYPPEPPSHSALGKSSPSVRCLNCGYLPRPPSPDIRRLISPLHFACLQSLYILYQKFSS